MVTLKLSAIAAAAMIAITGCTSAAPRSAAPASSPGAASPSPSVTPTPSITVPPWRLTWSDTFNGPAGSALSRASWKFDTGQGTFGTGEIETNTASTANVHLDGQGNLDLTALGQGAAGSAGAAWSSGRVETRRQFGAPAGGEMMVTASLKQPDPAQGIGYWPAFWMLGPKPATWPTTGEIDILEDVNALSVHGSTLHCGNLTQRNADGTNGPCHEGYGLGSPLQPCSGCQTAFHTYSVIVDRRVAGNEQIRWYLDGHEFFSVSETKVGETAWTAGVDHGFNILLDLAIGGSFPNARCRCTSPIAATSSGGTLSVGNVSVYTN